MNWTSPLIFLDDEDEEAMIAEYVRLSVVYSNHPPFAVAQVVFGNKPENHARANQAALLWSNRIDILERIRKAKLGDKDEVVAYTKDDWLAEILATSRDEDLAANAKKVKLDGLRDYGDGKGWRLKAAEPKNEDNNNTGKERHQKVFGTYDD